MRLKELDRTKTQGIKFSKAFSEFTVLVYHNIFGPGNGPESQSPTKLPQQQQFDNSNSQKNHQFKRKVTFAGSDKETGNSSMGLHQIDEDSDHE